jgi:hypothetical protein
MPIEVNSLEPSDLIEMAKQNGIDLSLDKNGKLEMHEGASRTAPQWLVTVITERWRDIEQYCRDHPQT